MKFELIPDGQYPATILGTKTSPLKNGAGVGMEVFALQKARAWFRVRLPDSGPPVHALTAIQMGQRGMLREPSEITVTASGDFPEMVRVVFSDNTHV